MSWKEKSILFFITSDSSKLKEQKNISPKKLFKVGDMISCVITEIDTEKRRIAISHKLTLKNPYKNGVEYIPLWWNLIMTIIKFK